MLNTEVIAVECVVEHVQMVV